MESTASVDVVEHAMFKRMSILEKRPGDDQAFFSRYWQERHGPLVARLPLIRAYVQNHVEEQYEPTSFRVGGIVELQFDDAAAMDEAFTADASQVVMADEANFLGNAAGYVIGDSSVRMAGELGKLVVLLAHGGDQTAVKHFEAALRRLPGFIQLIRDDVASTITRRGSARPGQRVDNFFHLYFSDVAYARRAGPQVAELAWGSFKLGVFQMRTVRIV
jgi:uncharacterized protein (TIGR02118 family)